MQNQQEYTGTFPFTNFTDKEFKTSWDGIEYTFPPLSTVPLIIPSASPLETQEIRKRFAKKLAIQAFYDTDTFKNRQGQTPAGSGLAPASYSDNDVEVFIARCLEPLEVKKATAAPTPKKEISLRTDAKGKPVTRVLDEGDSLVGDGSVMG